MYSTKKNMHYFMCLFSVSFFLINKAKSHTQESIPPLSSEPSFKKGPFFLKLMAGSSFSRQAHIDADPAYWDPAIEGYQTSLGTAPFVGLGFGYQLCDLLSSDVSFTHRWNFRYSKFQTVPAAIATPNPLPSKTRRFDLDTTTVMVNTRFHGKGMKNLWYPVNPHSYIAPIFGGGVGFSRHVITNFRSILAPTPLTAGASGVSSIGPSTTTHTSFSYQLEAGMEYSCQERWKFSLGYRWFDGGKFKGPSYIIAGTGLPGNPIVPTAAPSWTGKLKANELFFEWAYSFK